MKNRRIYLKVKIKSLAEEAKIIRREERKTRDQDLRDGLHRHRVVEVRIEARLTQLAYAYLSGKTRQQVEPNAVKPVNWSRVKTMVQRYSFPTEFRVTDFEAWTKAA